MAFTVQSVDLDQNTKPKQIFLVPTDGGAPRQITTQGTDNERPQWSPDSKMIAFISNRSGSSQVWAMKADGSDARQVTSLSTEASGVLFSPDGKKLLFLSQVYPDCSDDTCNRTRLDAEKTSKVKARSYTTLLFRHWTEWQTKRRSHLMVVDSSGGPVKDLTPGDHDVPPFSLGGPDDYAMAPRFQGSLLRHERRSAARHQHQRGPVRGSHRWRRFEKNHHESRRGFEPAIFARRKIPRLSQPIRGGYEADRWRLIVLERATGSDQCLTESLDRPVKVSPGRTIPSSYSSRCLIADARAFR